MTSVIQGGAALYQLSQQADWEVGIMLVPNKPLGPISLLLK